MIVDCTLCNTTGEFDGEPCRECLGDGAVETADNEDDLFGDGLWDLELPDCDDVDEWEARTVDQVATCRECSREASCWVAVGLCCKCGLPEGQRCAGCGSVVHLDLSRIF